MGEGTITESAGEIATIIDSIWNQKLFLELFHIILTEKWKLEKFGTKS